MNINYENSIYIIDRDFRLVEFDKAVADRYPEIRVGDLCYKAVMKRDTPCAHCPIAERSNIPAVIYYDAFYDGFVEAAFCELTGGKYCVTRHKVGVEGEHMKKQIERSIGFFDAFSHVFSATYYVDFISRTYSVFNCDSSFDGQNHQDNRWESALTNISAALSIRPTRKSSLRPAGLKPCKSGSARKPDTRWWCGSAQQRAAGGCALR